MRVPAVERFALLVASHSVCCISCSSSLLLESESEALPSTVVDNGVAASSSSAILNAPGVVDVASVSSEKP